MRQKSLFLLLLLLLPLISANAESTNEQEHSQQQRSITYSPFSTNQQYGQQQPYNSNTLNPQLPQQLQIQPAPNPYLQNQQQYDPQQRYLQQGQQQQQQQYPRPQYPCRDNTPSNQDSTPSSLAASRTIPNHLRHMCYSAYTI
uniref:Uncharacterized protein n=1 Tax=Ditylenchus dipsaci TaxID=166011 RepID=A0A915EPF7_9BILA